MKNCECEKGWWDLIFLLGPNLERDVLPNGLDPVGDELVDNVPRIISPFSYTTCVCVCVCVCTCVDAL